MITGMTARLKIPPQMSLILPKTNGPLRGTSMANISPRVAAPAPPTPAAA
jgi:hypothetical protein